MNYALQQADRLARAEDAVAEEELRRAGGEAAARWAGKTLAARHARNTSATRQSEAEEGTGATVEALANAEENTERVPALCDNAALTRMADAYGACSSAPRGGGSRCPPRASVLAAHWASLDTAGGGASIVSHSRRVATLLLSMAALGLKVEGDFVEAGTYTGGTAALMAMVLQTQPRPWRLLWACDSFHGLPPASENDIAARRDDPPPLIENAGVENSLGRRLGEAASAAWGGGLDLSPPSDSAAHSSERDAATRMGASMQGGDTAAGDMPLAKEEGDKPGGDKSGGASSGASTELRRIHPVSRLNGVRVPHQRLAASQQAFEANLRSHAPAFVEAGGLRVVAGWFATTLPAAPIRRIAFLRLDGDLYQSTFDALTALYDRVVPGGLIYVDDFGSFAGCARALREFRTTRNITEPLIPIEEQRDPRMPAARRYEAVWWQKRTASRLGPSCARN